MSYPTASSRNLEARNMNKMHLEYIKQQKQKPLISPLHSEHSSTLPLPPQPYISNNNQLINGLSTEDFDNAIRIFTYVRDQLHLSSSSASLVSLPPTITDMIHSASVVHSVSRHTEEKHLPMDDHMHSDMIINHQHTSYVDNFKYHVAFLVSQPLLHAMGNDLKTVAPLNVAYEEQKMYDTSYTIHYTLIIIVF